MRKSKILPILLCFFMLTSGVMPYSPAAYSNPLPESLCLPTDDIQPPMLVGIKFYPNDPLKLDFILHQGQSSLTPQQAKEEALKQIRYFLAALTIPEQDIWVNLSPYEHDRIIPQDLGFTEMGNDLLQQDYVLKQLSASLTYPDIGAGKEFWRQIYQKINKVSKTTRVPVSTFNKIWIVPDKAVVYEDKDKLVITEAKLKVMLEQDYLALSKNKVNPIGAKDSISLISSQAMRNAVLPSVEKEVNRGKHFIVLRQIYNSMVLAICFKQTLKRSIEQSFLGKVYIDKQKTGGIKASNSNAKEAIYRQYIRAFKEGAYNFNKKELDIYRGRYVTRNYFSGGFAGNRCSQAIERPQGPVPAEFQGKVVGQSYLVPTRLDPDALKYMAKRAGVKKILKGKSGKVSMLAYEAKRQNKITEIALKADKIENKVGIVRQYIMGSKVNPRYIDMLENLLVIVEKESPEFFTFSTLVKDLFGVASAKSGIIAIYGALAGNPVANLHEMLEYLVGKGILRLEFDGSDLSLRFFKNSYVIPLSREGLKIAQRGPANPHYLLRAMQRTFFQHDDKALSAAIREMQPRDFTVHTPELQFPNTQTKKFQELRNLLLRAESVIGAADPEELLDDMRSIIGDQDLTWNDLDKDLYLSYVGSGSHKDVFKISVLRQSGEVIEVSFAFKQSGEGGLITPEEVRDVQQFKGERAPHVGAKLHVESDGSTWYLEEFISGDTAYKLMEDGKLTIVQRKNIVDTALFANSVLGHVPRDIHANNFIMRDNGDEAVMFDFGGAQLHITGKDSNPAQRISFLAILLANYGLHNAARPEDNHFIFDAIMESPSLRAADKRMLLESAYAEVQRIGISGVNKILYSARHLFWEQRITEGFDKFSQEFSEALGGYVTKMEANPGILSPAHKGGVDLYGAESVIRYANRKSAYLSGKTYRLNFSAVPFDLSNFRGFTPVAGTAQRIHRWEDI